MVQIQLQTQTAGGSELQSRELTIRLIEQRDELRMERVHHHKHAILNAPWCEDMRSSDADPIFRAATLDGRTNPRLRPSTTTLHILMQSCRSCETQRRRASALSHGELNARLPGLLGR